MRTGKYIIYLFCVLLLLNSCKKNTFEQNPLTESDIAAIKSIAIIIDSDNKFSVRYPTKKPNLKSAIGDTAFYAAGAAAFTAFYVAPVSMAIAALIYGSVGYKLKKHKDNSHVVYRIDIIKTWHFKKYVKNYNPSTQLSQFITENLGSSTDIFSKNKESTVNLEQLRSKGYDNLLKLSIEQWGFYLCYDSPEWKKYFESCTFVDLQSLSETVQCSEPIPSNNIRAGVQISLKLISLGRNKTLYENKKLYLSPECKNAEKLSSIKEYVEENLNDTLKIGAFNIANQFLIQN